MIYFIYNLFSQSESLIKFEEEEEEIEKEQNYPYAFNSYLGISDLSWSSNRSFSGDSLFRKQVR